MQNAVFIATSLDGFIARRDGSIDWLMRPEYAIEGEDYGYADFMADISCLVMGRRTFEQVLSFPEWPYDGKRLIVMSRSMSAVPQGYEQRAELFSGTPGALVAKLNSEGETRAYVDGGQLIQAFLRDDLIDDLTLTRLPILLGQGLPLFGELAHEQRFKHVETRYFDSGLVQSRYRRLSN